MRVVKWRVLVAGVGLPLLLAAATAPAPPEGADARETRPPVHTDARETEDALKSSLRAFLMEDAATARHAMDRLDAACIRLSREDPRTFPPGVVTYDLAFHSALAAARELAGRGRIDEAFERFLWIQRGCRECHALSRKAGIMPPARTGAR